MWLRRMLFIKVFFRNKTKIVPFFVFVGAIFSKSFTYPSMIDEQVHPSHFWRGRHRLQEETVSSAHRAEVLRSIVLRWVEIWFWMIRGGKQRKHDDDMFWRTERVKTMSFSTEDRVRSGKISLQWKFITFTSLSDTFGIKTPNSNFW